MYCYTIVVARIYVVRVAVPPDGSLPCLGMHACPSLPSFAQVVEDAELPDPTATFQRRGGGKARRYWGKVNRGVKNFRRRRERRRLQHRQTRGGDVAGGVSRFSLTTVLSVLSGCRLVCGNCRQVGVTPPFSRYYYCNITASITSLQYYITISSRFLRSSHLSCIVCCVACRVQFGADSCPKSMDVEEYTLEINRWSVSFVARLRGRSTRTAVRGTRLVTDFSRRTCTGYPKRW